MPFVGCQESVGSQRGRSINAMEATTSPMEAELSTQFIFVS